MDVHAAFRQFVMAPSAARRLGSLWLRSTCKMCCHLMIFEWLPAGQPAMPRQRSAKLQHRCGGAFDFRKNVKQLDLCLAKPLNGGLRVVR